MTITRNEFADLFNARLQNRVAQRLSAIGEYFAVVHNCVIDVSSKEQCLKSVFDFCTNEPALEQSVFDAIKDILWDRHSFGDPYYLYNLSPIITDFKKLTRKVNHCLKGSIDNHLFTFQFGRISHKRKFGVDWNYKRIQVTCRYVEYRADFRGERTEEVIFTGQIKFVLDIQSQRLLIGSGYNKAVSNLVQLINEHCKDALQCREINIRSVSKNMPNASLSDFSSLTLLSIYLMKAGFQKGNYAVPNISAILFNNEKAPYVRNAKLSGQNLLADYDVAHRLSRQGDKVVFFQVFLRKVNSAGAGNIIFQGDVTVDFRKGLKITIGNGADSIIHNYETVLDVEKIINGALTGSDTVHKAENIIRVELAEAAKSPLERVFRALYKDLLEKVPKEQSNIKKLFVEYGFSWD